MHTDARIGRGWAHSAIGAILLALLSGIASSIGTWLLPKEPPTFKLVQLVPFGIAALGAFAVWAIDKSWRVKERQWIERTDSLDKCAARLRSYMRTIGTRTVTAADLPLMIFEDFPGGLSTSTMLREAKFLAYGSRELDPEAREVDFIQHVVLLIKTLEREQVIEEFSGREVDSDSGEWRDTNEHRLTSHGRNVARWMVDGLAPRLAQMLAT